MAKGMSHMWRSSQVTLSPSKSLQWGVERGKREGRQTKDKGEKGSCSVRAKENGEVGGHAKRKGRGKANALLVIVRGMEQAE